MRQWMLFVLLAMVVALFVYAQKEKDESSSAWSKTAPAADNKQFEQILDYRKKGDFERAVAVATESINGKQPDDFLLQTTAVTYFQWAQADHVNKEKWITLAVQYSERALKANPTDPVNTFDLGDSYMAAGMNLGKPSGCPHYEKSLQLFEELRASPALQGEWGTIDGQRVRLLPYRQKLDGHVKNLRLLAAGCRGFHKAQ